MSSANDRQTVSKGPAPRPTPFTSGTITVGYPFDKREREALDELQREDRDGQPDER